MYVDIIIAYAMHLCKQDFFHLNGWHTADLLAFLKNMAQNYNLFAKSTTFIQFFQSNADSYPEHQILWLSSKNMPHPNRQAKIHICLIRV
ncbi:MAG: hypothetical protein K2L85_02215, partial [Paramuribaculum sp.]|nr:hypothetical protein [Paramuribaculum sp.]